MPSYLIIEVSSTVLQILSNFELKRKRVYFNELTNEEKGPYDDWPLIWKKFQSKGYSTAFIEDYPSLTLFNYESKGFPKKKPTDFYTRPLWLHMRNHIQDSDFCLDHKIPLVDVFLDKVQTFVEKKFNKSEPSFTFAFLIEMTHDEFNNAQIIDTHFANFIKQLRKQLKQMIFIVMGDHGNRFGDILNTVIGRIEERMPLFAIHLPQKLSSKYPHLNEFLNKNDDKLISWLDLHQLLLDIVNRKFNPRQRNERAHRPNIYSPWRQLIPLNRTCSQALIPDMYCVCHERKLIDTNLKFVELASKVLVRHINHMLPLSLCQYLTLNSTINAEIILPNESTVNEKTFEQHLEITILVNPSGGLIRAQLYRSATYDWSVRGDVTRINKYGNQSHCINDRILKLFCYCRLQ